MSEQRTETGNRYSIKIGGAVTNSQIAAGSQITQSQTIVPVEVIGEDGLRELREQIAAIRRQVEAVTPAERRDVALAQVAELEESLTAGTPQLSRLARARNWLAEQLPAVAGAVTSLIVHPLVGRLVEAAGDALVTEFRQLFGVEPSSGERRTSGE